MKLWANFVQQKRLKIAIFAVFKSYLSCYEPVGRGFESLPAYQNSEVDIYLLRYFYYFGLQGLEHECPNFKQSEKIWEKGPVDLSILSDGTDSVQKNRQTALSGNSVKSINYRILKYTYFYHSNILDKQIKFIYNKFR